MESSQKTLAVRPNKTCTGIGCCVRVILVAFYLGIGSSCAQVPAGATWEQLNVRAVSAFRAGKLAEATTLAKRALELARQNPGTRDAGTLQVMCNLAQILNHNTKFRDAEQLYNEALPLMREVLGATATLTLITEAAFAGNLYNEGEYRKSEAAYLQVMELFPKRFSARSAESLLLRGNFALLLTKDGRYDEAEPIYRDVINIQQDVLGSKHHDTLLTKSNLIVLLDDTGRWEEAERIGKEVLQAEQETLGPNARETLATMTNLAVLLDHAGRYGEAEQMDRDALQRSRVALGPDHPDTLTAMGNLALVLDRQVRTDEAERLLRETLQSEANVLGPRHPKTLITMSNLATVLFDSSKYDEAERIITTVWRMQLDSLGPRHPATLTSLHNLATFIGEQGRGRYEEAEVLLRDVLQSRREVLGPKNNTTLLTEDSLAITLTEEGKYDEADPLYQELMTVGRDIFGPYHPDFRMFQRHFIRNLAGQRKFAEAIGVEHDMEGTLLTWVGSEYNNTESANGRRELASSSFLYQSTAIQVALLPGSGPDAAALAAETLLRFKGIALEEDAYLARLSRTGQDQQIRALATDIAVLHGQLARLVQVGGRATHDLSALVERLDAEELELGRIGRRDTPYLRVRETTLENVRARLPPKSGLLELRLYQPTDHAPGGTDNRWAGILITSDGKTIVRDLGASSTTSRLVEAMLGNPLIGGSDAPAAKLYQQILAPFEGEIANLQRLYLVPDGSLYLLPFGLLHGVNGQRVMDRLDLRFLQSGRDLLHSVASQPAEGLVAAGDIDFNAAPGPDEAAKSTAPQPIQTEQQLVTLARSASETLRGGFGPLRHSAQEIDAIGKLYHAARPTETIDIVAGAAPTKSWLLSLAPPRVLHLATHGFYRPTPLVSDRPMLFAGIALAGANQAIKQGGQGGILFALEAEDLNLEGTELVVLSACDTARGQIDYGDGLSGLVRALRTAGVRHVLVTLSPVDDEGAARFMQSFYKIWLLQSESDPAAALREAQREAARSGEKDDTWTRFVLIGD